MFSSQKHNVCKGFSLVELSISLVIMGLLVIGGLAGKELIKASEIRAVIVEIEGHKIAIGNFVEQYSGLPGDLKNAEEFWGTYPGDSGGTINGNDNGRIDGNEIFRAWHQLGLAKLSQGVFTSADDATDTATPGTNVPRSGYINAGYSLIWNNAPGAWVDDLGRNFPGNYLILGSLTSGSEVLTSSSVTPNDAFSIDEKIDNEQPDYGKVLSVNGDGVTTCTTDVGPNDAEYLLTNFSLSCVVYLNLE